MKLLYLSGAPTVSTDEKAQSGGPRAHILGIISGFKAHGWTVTEFIFGNRFKDRLKNSPPAIQLSRNFLLRLASDLFRVFIGLVNQRKVASSFPGFNLCYERFAAFQALGAGLKKRLGTPWILETNGIYFLEAKKDRRSIVMSSLCRKLEEKAYQECDYLVLISEDLRNLVLHHFRVSPDKILVIPNGVDTERFKPAAGPPAKGTNAFTIGFVGGLIDWCGLGGLFEAVALLKKDLPVPVNLVVAGDGISKDRFISKCKQLGLENSVAFLGN
ncbi:glycosyltransferase, partial [bacterium]|nr:glycosyltransferase [bacterium]